MHSASAIQSAAQRAVPTQGLVAAAQARPMASNHTAGRPKSSNKRSAPADLERPAASYQPQAAQHMKPEPIPLKYVVQEAVKRWFEDTLQEASRGDVKQQALLGEMYKEGYGCNKDARAGKEWAEKAAARGYKMQGVYCEL